MTDLEKQCFEMFIADMQFDIKKNQYLISLDPMCQTDTRQSDEEGALRLELEKVSEADWFYYISEERLKEYFLKSVMRFYVY